MFCFPAVTPGAGVSALIGILNADGKIDSKIWPVLNFVTVLVKTSAGEFIRTTPIVLDDLGNALEISRAIPELETTYTAHFRLLGADATEIPSEEYAEFEKTLRARHAEHVASETYHADRRRRLAERNAELNSPEGRARQQKIVDATVSRLAREREERLTREEFGLVAV